MKYRHFLLSLLVLLPFSLSLDAVQDRSLDNSQSFVFSQLPNTPVSLDGALLGDDAGTLLLAGGYHRDSGDANFTVYALRSGAETWEVVGELPEHRAYAGTANSSGGVILVGGTIDGEPSAQVMRMQLVENELQFVALPELPKPLLDPAVTIFNRFLYVAGGVDSVDGSDFSTDFMRLEWERARPNWQQLPTWPGVGRAGSTLQHSIESLYLLGGYSYDGVTDEVFAYHSRYQWRVQGDAPFWCRYSEGRRLGDSHIFVFSGIDAGDEARDEIYAYHAITDTWIQLSQFELEIPRYPQTTTSAGRLIVLSEINAWAIDVLPLQTNFGLWDYLAVLLYIFGMIGMGIYFIRLRKNTKDYFRGGNVLPWWATGMSLFATGASAISLLAMPGKSYSTNWTYFAISVCSVIALPISLFLLAPLVRKLNLATANEYLDLRFGTVARMLGSCIFIFTQVFGRMGPVMLLPAIAMNAITGIDIVVCILVMGLTVTAYTYLGGLGAVVWTDTVQGFLMIAAVSGCLVLIFLKVDISFAEVFSSLGAEGKLHAFDWGWDITYPTIWMILLGTLVTTMMGIGDQNYIQRVQATPTLRDAKKAIATQMAVAVPINVLLFSLGTALYIFYQQNPASLNPAMENDGIFPFFAAQQLPPGVSGLVIAALLAATMSTISSSVCSVANLGVDDFYRRFSRNPSDRTAIALGRILTLLVGLSGIAVALYLAKSSIPSVWDMALLLTNLISNGIVGLFGLGLLTKRANQWGALLGVGVGMAIVFYLQRYTEVTFWLYPVIGTFVTMVGGYIFSILLNVFAGHKARSLPGLTVYTLREEREHTASDGTH